MTLGPVAFGALSWGAAGAVALVFVYEVYALRREFGPGGGGDG